MKYEVRCSVWVEPKPDSEGWTPPNSSLAFNQSFTLEGDSFAGVARRIDALYAAMQAAAEDPQDLRDVLIMTGKSLGRIEAWIGGLMGQLQPGPPDGQV
jgi:hypothetical protein